MNPVKIRSKFGKIRGNVNCNSRFQSKLDKFQRNCKTKFINTQNYRKSNRNCKIKFINTQNQVKIRRFLGKLQASFHKFEQFLIDYTRFNRVELICKPNLSQLTRLFRNEISEIGYVTGASYILTQLNLTDTKLSNLNVKNPGLDELLTERAAAGASYAGQLEWSATGL